MFVRFTTTSGSQVEINMKNVNYMREYDSGSTTIVMNNSSNYLTVKGSLDEVSKHVADRWNCMGRDFK